MSPGFSEEIEEGGIIKMQKFSGVLQSLDPEICRGTLFGWCWCIRSLEEGQHGFRT